MTIFTAGVVPRIRLYTDEFAAALEAECEVLYSEDLQSGRKFDRLRVVNPFLSLKS